MTSIMRRSFVPSAVAAVVGILASFGGVAVANHVFPDVGDNATFHDEVAEVGFFGCASGFGDGTFRGQQNINRQQAAGWIARCGTRVRVDSEPNGITLTGALDLDTLFDVEVVDHSDGIAEETAGGFLLATVDLTRVSGCACEVTLSLVDGLAGEQIFDQEVVEIGASATTVRRTLLTGFNAYDGELELVAETTAGAGTVDVSGDLVALTAPFTLTGVTEEGGN